MSENNVAIEIENLTKTYTDFRGRPKAKALQELSLTIKKGEVFGLLGPNGSGKTTTIKLLLGLIFPTSGTAKVLGKPATDVSVKHSIGFLPEESYLYKFLDAEETLEFYGQIFGMKKAERRAKADELIKRLGLDYARKRQVKEYSKGMARRIGFAQALINDPEVLFLDEPTSGLDPIGTREMKDLILELKSEGKTILLSSHLLADVQDVCDRIAILHLGTLRKLGPVRDLLKIRDVLQVTLAGLDEKGEERVAKVLAENAEILDMSHPSESLEDLFLKTIQENPREGDQESYRQEWGRKVAEVAPEREKEKEQKAGSEAKKESSKES
ncbi:MAG: ABC transporter ATP-binding protein [Planctomycetota bacterium]|jgi:ABC-2 type transport system ATP-binding protein|nr:ABC transporter ATP-binding protein [Planctomycetota bacterium]MDP7129534.1 ABC transporter ATP-binding protein [Planctomycetota bacterium]MDP7251200.1 ABC transporter ATP-binding protein [Planctomycetota bacterium]